ncbi:NADPH-dependent assimilatory sulfite reductase hemoprotein subunit [Alicyclobacillus shizuokensis]|uniref:NADPH-dependent assimilatory sulfite reductase hemoprotein subunit n=1 Tax=Alicyclobacillus shizuokensis TaxID=392014 RepID=UPI000834766F|nr:NADPH-dependent assimilatory sulfite reductase hemoprotein subunit [Alicyclobacillus shizuokensis]
MSDTQRELQGQPGESKIETIKRDSHHLRGTITEALQDGKTSFSEENIQVLKFHGVYQQDDRDLRKQLKKEGKERHYMMMVRARIPGGVLTADQYLRFDQLADEYGNGTLRITTRQTFQMHGILKANLKETIRSLNEALVTTLGGCGDQVRNITSCPEPRSDAVARQLRADQLALVARFGARTKAYHEIWLDGEEVTPNYGGDAGSLSDVGAGAGQRGEGGNNPDRSDEEEPLYGRTYLPRKFKIGLTYEGDNCCDVYSNDIGLVAHAEGDRLVGYTLLVGGGMGRTAGDPNTYPRAATPLAFVTRDELLEVCEAILTVQRDYGNRSNRRFARMKYLIDERGLEWFQGQVEARIGRSLTPPRPLTWQSSEDHLGWRVYGDKAYLGVYIENGRLLDREGLRLRTVLREIVSEYQPTIHLTTQQNLILANLPQNARADIESRLRAAGVKLAEDLPRTRLVAMACPALPTCGLAIAESERALPSVLPQFEALFAEYGLENEPISVRMTGCPNGCARPYLADIGFVGRAIGKYDVFLGADSLGTRVNRRFLELVPINGLVEAMRPLIAVYAKERRPGERFGNYCHRVGFEYLEKVRADWAASGAGAENSTPAGV